MPFRLLIVSLLLIASSAAPLPSLGQAIDTSGPVESTRRFSEAPAESRITPKAITPRTRTASAKADESGHKASSASSVWTTFGSLAVVVFLILLIARSWKKHGPTIGGQLPSEAVELLGRKHIDARQTLHLVRLGSRMLLLGSSAGGLRTLAEITDPVDVDYLAGVCRQSTTDGTVAQTFRALFNRRSTADDSSNRQASVADQPAERQARGKGDAARFHRPDMEGIRG